MKFFFFILLSFFVIGALNAKDTLRFHQHKVFYFVPTVTSSGFSGKGSSSGIGIYHVGILLRPKFGYIFHPQFGGGFIGGYGFVKSNIMQEPPFHFFGPFLEYFPFKKRKVFVSTSLYRSNVVFRNPPLDSLYQPIEVPNLILSKGKWNYTSIGFGSSINLTKSLFLYGEIEWMISIPQVKFARNPVNMYFGLMFIPQLAFKKNKRF